MEDDIFGLCPDTGISYPLGYGLDNTDNLKRLNNSNLYLNIHNLVDTVYSAVLERKLKMVSPEQYVERLDSDLALVNQIARANNANAVIVYDVMYENLKAKGLTKLITPKTDNQLAKAKELDAIYKLAKVFVDKEFKRNFTNDISDRSNNSLVYTHMPVDLLDYAKFNNLLLLERFTGRIKDWKDFNTKLNVKDEDLEYLPFNRVTLKVFGDGKFYAKQPKAITAKVLEIAKKSNWTKLTTESRVMFCLNRYDKPLADLISDSIR